jgi:hypothetical protein
MVAKERIANKKDRKGKKRTTMFLSGAGKKKQDPGGWKGTKRETETTWRAFLWSKW